MVWCVRTSHEARHEGFGELQDAVVDVLEEGVEREAAHGEHGQQRVVAWEGRAETEKRRKTLNLIGPPTQILSAAN